MIIFKHNTVVSNIFGPLKWVCETRTNADWYAYINSCYVYIWLGMKYEPGKGATKFLNPGAVWFVDENVAAIINTCHAYYVQDLTTRVILN